MDMVKRGRERWIKEKKKTIVSKRMKGRQSV